MPTYTREFCKKNFRKESKAEGQALVEFTLVLPILIFLMLASYMVGAAMYTGSNASSSLRAALQAKSAYADSENPLADFESTVNSYNTGTFRIPGTTIDSVALTATTDPVSVIVAQKAVDFPLFPTFNFTVTQGVKSNLLNNNINETGLGATSVPFADAEPQTAAGISPSAYSFDSDVPLYVPITPNCIPDLSVFDQATMVAGCDGVCRATGTQNIFTAHITPVENLGGCGGLADWSRTPAVTFQ